MNTQMLRCKGLIINLDRIPYGEWSRIFEATKDRNLIFKINTTLQKKSVKIIEEIRKHGEVMIDTRLGEYLPAIDECIEMYKPYNPWGITFRCCNEYAMRQALYHRIMTIAIASLRIIGTDEECLRRNGRTCDEVILRLDKDALRVDIRRIICSTRELSVIRNTAIGNNFEIIVYGNYPLWNLDPGLHQPSAIVSPADALKMGADFISISAPVTNARPVIDPAGLVIEAYHEFSRHFQE